MELNKKNVRKILLIIAFAILLLVCLQRFDSVLAFFSWLFRLFSPFLMGACIAFILNVPMRFIESKLFPAEGWRARGRRGKTGQAGDAVLPAAGPDVNSRGWRVREKLRRPVSMVLALAAVTGVIIVVLFLILPELGRTLMSLADRVPAFVVSVQDWLTELTEQYPDIYQQVKTIQLDWQKIGNDFVAFLQNWAASVLGSTVGVVTSVVSGVMNFLLGLFFALYVLIQKEKLGRQSRRVLYAFLPEKWADRLLSVGKLSNQTFSSFLSGQCFEAVILGAMFFICMSIFRFPYALMISVLIAFTALIPIFGAFIGCFVGAFLILMVDPLQAVWFVVMFVIIQQIEGNLIYPHVVGGSVGLPSLWVLVAVTVGGSLMGIVGMLVFIPLCSVLYALFRQTVIVRLREREIPSAKLQNEADGPDKRKRLLKRK
ncbi:MAG: AI-2E family transporter [Clostridiales bacterium]|nr:AI-2E family transporter [Clostridiales bacterium]